jgi:CheY-specific phosphatase CheX
MVTALSESHLLAATAEVLESMCFATVERQAPSSHDILLFAAKPELSVGKYLHFRGAFSGSFGVRTSPGAARVIAGNLLGEDEEDVCDDQANEAIGEIANMICGAMLSKIEGRQTFRLSSPEPWSAESILLPHAVVDTSPLPEIGEATCRPESLKHDASTGFAVPGVLQCLFELDCGQLLAWMRVS